MPIGFDLEELRIKHKCVNYFETGLWDPREDVSSRKALACGFDKVYCIEIREDWVNLGKEIFHDEIAKGRYNLIKDDSSNMAEHVRLDTFNQKTLFFLDAHVDNSKIHGYKHLCPLFDELNAINSLARKDHLILIDDLRILRTPRPWGENSYGSINFLYEIKKQILTINPEYNFITLDGVIKNDVLLAYVNP
jgi:hypothetical protein